jgi:hypothetical protein
MVRGFALACAAVFGLAVTLTTAGTAGAAPVQKASGAKMCVLTQADFRPFGTLVWSKPVVNAEQGGENVYCVYRGKSGATGGVELDVFYPAGENAADVEQTFKTTLNSDPGGHYLPERVQGADESEYALDIPQSGSFPFAANVVRRGGLVFSISLPSSPMSKIELLKLSEIVLSRLAKE